MKTTSTNWSSGTTCKLEAIELLKNALLSGRSAWIEIRKNIYENGLGEGLAFPLTTKNSGLNNPFNWTMLYGTIYPKDYSGSYYNDTEKDLHNNWTVLYATSEAREAYINEGKVIKGLNNGIGRCTPVRIKDADKTRTDGYKYKGRTIVWKPENLAYQIPDPDIKEVFVIVTDNEKTINENEVLAELEYNINQLKNMELKN